MKRREGFLNRWFAVIALVLGAAAGSLAQLRVATWNISNYGGGRTSAIQTAVYGQFQGRQFAPDVITTQEFLTASAVTQFLDAINTAPGSPGDYAAAAFINGADTDCGFFYRTSKVSYLGTTVVAIGSPETSNQPRNTYRYDFRPVGYSTNTSTICLYSSHMKAGNTTDDQSRRLIEAQRIRDDAELMGSQGKLFILGADLNIPTHTQTAYQELVGPQANNFGRFFDPIASPGIWNNNLTFRFIHTQDPVTAMDDRFDQLLVASGLIDSSGMDYIGIPATPYSTTTWNDLNHSYRCWGNDGSTYNGSIATTNNSMVGPIIAQALLDCATTAGGHLPVFLDLRVAGKVNSTSFVDFGSVRQGSVAARTLTVQNVGDTDLWSTAGVANLSYSLQGSPKFSAPGGTFVAPPGGSGEAHQITLDTSSPGFFKGTVTITSNDPDQPTRVVQVRAKVFASRGF